MTATFQQPDYTSQSGTAYPLSIDAAIAVLAESARAFAPNERTSPDMSIAVGPGRLWDGATLTVKPAAQVAILSAADPTNPRIDRVYVTAAGTIGVVAGTPAGSPAAPAYPGGAIPVAQVYVAAGATAIYNADITDDRALMPFVAGGTVGGLLDIITQGAADQRHLRLLQPNLADGNLCSLLIFGRADSGDNSGILVYRPSATPGQAEVWLGHNGYDGNALKVFRDGAATLAGKALLTAPDAPAGYTRYSAFYMINDVPALNAPSLNVDTVLAKNTWVSVGPTGSGATYVWTALDAVPATAKLVELRGLAYLNTLATTVDTATLQARKTGTSTNSPWIVRQQVLSDGTTRAYDNTETNFKVQIDANRRFDLLWDGENFGGSATIILYLVGWYE